MGSKSDGGRGAAIAAAREAAERSARAFEGISLPEIEKQRLQLEEYVNEGLLTPEELADTELSRITLDPRYKQAQMEALKEMQELGKTGLGAEDRYALSQIQDTVAAQEQARQASILRDMAERGTLESGEQLAAQLSSSQSATNRAAEQGQQLAAQAAQARRQALEQASGLAGQLRQADYGQQSDVARARDIAAQFNAQNRFNVQQQNLANRQRLSESNVGLRNTQQQYNKELLQRQYENQLKKAAGISGGYQNVAQTSMQAAQLAQAKPGWGGAIGALAGAGIGGYFGQAKGAEVGANVGGAAGSQFNEGGLRVDEALDAGLIDKNKEAQKELLAIARGDIMPEDSSNGRIIGGESYSGDALPDKINSGEMVLNVKQQDNIKKQLDKKTAQNQGFMKILEMLGRENA